MKKALALILTLVMVLGVVACGQKQAEPAQTQTQTQTQAEPQAQAGEVDWSKEKKFTLKLGHEQPDGHPYDMGAKKFAELVEQYSGGSIHVDVFPQSSLGNAAAMAESVDMGTLDFSSVFSIQLESFCPDLGVLTLPYCFSSWDHCFAALDGDFGTKLKEACLKTSNIRILDFWANGLAQVHSTTEIRTPDQMAGKKFRIQTGATYAALSEALNAVTTPMALKEVYAALQMGAMDCQLQTIVNIDKQAFYEVAKYYTEINMCFNTNPFIMSNETWNKLSANQQEAVMKAAREACVYEREQLIGSMDSSMEKAVAGGLQVIKLTDAELQQWRDACTKVYENPNFSSLMPLFEEAQTYKK